MDDSQTGTPLLDHNGVISAPGSQTGSHLGHTPNLSRQEFVPGSNLYLPIRSPDGGMPGSSPAKHALPEKSPHGHPALMTSPIPTSGMFSDDHFLIHSLDGNVYDQAPSGVSHGSHLQTDFNLDSIDFMVLDELGSESRAFPPLSFPQNTPALAAHSHASIMRSLLPAAVASPILPGQNLKSYNQEHLYHKQRQQHQQNQHRQQQSLISSLGGHAPKHIRPDAVFTPLVSPAGTPLDMLMNSNGQQAIQLRDFEPLTSPALKAQPQGSLYVSLQARPPLHKIQSSDRTRSLSTLGADDYSSGSSAKRKTPHLTPNLAAHSSSKAKSPMLNKVPPSFEKLPETSFEGMGAPAKSTETTPMLPPQGKRVAIEPGSGLTPGSGGPGPMMGFTMNRLAEQQSGSYDSPSAGKVPKATRRLSRSSSQRSVDYSAKQYASSLSETSPMLEAQSDSVEFGSRNGKMPTKKASHKLAEQGRRNRMNNAIQELSLLIPAEFHERAPIPSKATTVELAAEYISTLLNEIEGLKQKIEKPVRVKKEHL